MISLLSECLFLSRYNLQGSNIFPTFIRQESSVKKLVLLLLYCLLVQDLYSQHFVSKKWDARFGGINGDVMSSVAETTDGGFILGGTSVSNISGDISL